MDSIEIYGGAIESPKESTDFIAGNLINSGLLPTPEELPDKISFDPDGQVLSSQGATVSCTAQAATNAIEATAWAQSVKGENKKVEIDAFDQYRYQTKVYPRTAGRNGDYTKSACRALIHRSNAEGGIPAIIGGEKTKLKIDSFARVEADATVLRQYLSAGFAVEFSADVKVPPGGGRSNWREAASTGRLEVPTGWVKVGGHATSILIGYDFTGDEGYFICGNSYGTRWGAEKNGTFRIYESQLKNLHASAFVFFLDEEFLKERIFKDVSVDHWAAKEIFQVLEAGIMRGSNSDNIEDPKKRAFNPDKPVTRAELAVVVSRLMNK